MYSHYDFFKKSNLHIEINTQGSFKYRWYKKDPARGVFNIHVLKGAGYKSGFTFYLAFNLKHPENNNRKLFQFGVTHDANSLPYIDN